MKRVILHLGFHKTGSSSVQELLRRNRDLLSPAIGCVIQKDPELRPLEAACRAYDKAPNARNRVRLRRRWRRLASRLGAAWAEETVMVSSEDLMGRIPSDRDRREIYARGAEIIGNLQEATPEIDLDVAFYIRDGAVWRESLYRHLVHTRSLGLTADDFAALEKFKAPDAALRRAAERVAGAVNGRMTLLSFEEDLAAALGPGTGLLALAGVGETARAGLRQVPRQNVGIDADRVAEIQKSAPKWLPKPLRRTVVKLRSR